MKRMLLILLAAGLWHSAASAEDYYWQSGQTGLRYSSATALCQAWVGDTAYYRLGKMVFPSPDTVQCYRVRLSDSFEEYRSGGFRGGSSCPAGSEYNPTTGECVAPEEDECLPTRGDRISHRHKLGEINLGAIATTPPPATICQASCRYSDYELDGKPYRFVSGDPSGAWANFFYFGDGVSCTAGDTESDAPDSGKPKADSDKKCTNRVCLTVDESGNCQTFTYSCTETQTYTDPGKMDCDFGEFNGSSVCVPNSPSPQQTEKEVTTEVEEKHNPDGSTETTTTTTTNTTNCSGVGACSTTTTTNVSTSNTNGDGSDGGSSSTCTGADCKDGEGKSQAEREKQEKEEEEKQGSVSGESCDATVSCEGDAVQCAILRQQKEMRCEAEKQADFESNKTDIEGLFEGEKFQLDQTEIAAEGFINTAGRFLPANGCPSPENMNLRLNGGRSFELNYEPLCQAASDLSWLIVSIASLLAALYVGRSFGGS